MAATRRRRTAAVTLAVVGVAGLTLASAAQLTVTGSSLAAGTTVVAACDPDDGVTVGFETAYSSGAYAATAVTVGDIDEACQGQDIRVTLTDGDTVLEEVTGTVPAGGEFVGTLTTPQDAAAIDGAAVLIHS